MKFFVRFIASKQLSSDLFCDNFSYAFLSGTFDLNSKTYGPFLSLGVAATKSDQDALCRRSQLLAALTDEWKVPT